MESERLRLADILGSLALAIELGLGLPAQTIQRTAIVAVRLARAAGLDDEDVVATYYLSVLRYVGCSTTAHKTSMILDELALGELLVVSDEEFMSVFETALRATMPEAQARAVAQAMSTPTPEMGHHHRNHCEAGELMAKRFGLGPRVVDGLTHAYERWDGMSTQKLAEGEAISLPMRLVQVAWQVGQDSTSLGAADIARRLLVRAGRSLDPWISRLAAGDTAALLAGLDEGDLTQAMLDAEPGSAVVVADAEIERVLTGIADFGDLKSPHMIGHSRRVASVARAAARAASMPTADVALVERAGLVHDIGRVGLQSSLLSKQGTLTRSEHERIRLHSYLTERIFACNPVLAPLGAVGSAHHERLDGSGYHRGLSATGLAAPARLLAAANAWCALTEARPHRPQMTEAEAADFLLARAKEGLFDRNAVDAVLVSAGKKGQQTRRAAWIALSEREIEVLRLVAREETNASIAATMGISPKTVERHVTHIYDKIGISTRAGAAIYALEKGLI
jgi:HD-GYP domain-containing protein (c-di-GMP phosphodiesterase class II)